MPEHGELSRKKSKNIIENISARESKAKVRELEIENYSAIILWQSSEKWWKMCQNSALIYAYEVAPKLEKTAIIRIDTDRYFNAEDGVISIPDITKLTEELSRLHITPSKKCTEQIKIFNLPEALKAETLDNFRSEERGRRDKVNAILAGSNLYPYINSEARKTLSVIYNTVRKLDSQRYNFIGSRLERTMIHFYILKNQMERKEILPNLALRQMEHDCSLMMTYVDIAYELQFLETRRVEGIAKHIYNMRTEISKILKEFDAPAQCGTVKK